jgi:hypothetical protein
MTTVQKFFIALSLSLSLSLATLTSGLSSASAQAGEAFDFTLVNELARTALACAHQPYALTRTGKKIYGSLKSGCNELRISLDRAQFSLQGRVFTVVVKESEYSDDGDLNDLYVQYDAREDQEVLIRKNVLSFGDPVLAVLLTSRHSVSELPEVMDQSLLK